MIRPNSDLFLNFLSVLIDVVLSLVNNLSTYIYLWSSTLDNILFS